jgi:hypothetical protein
MAEISTAAESAIITLAAVVTVSFIIYVTCKCACKDDDESSEGIEMDSR